MCSVGWDHLGSAPGPSTPGHYGDASDNMFQDLTPTSFIAEFNGPSRFFPNLNQLLGSFTDTFALSFQSYQFGFTQYSLKYAQEVFIITLIRYNTRCLK